MALEPYVILVLDDDGPIRELIQLYLGDAGYKLIIASELGEQALAQASIVKPDLALIDLHLPDAKLSGFDTIAKLREKFPDIKIIGFSGYHDWKQTALELGANAFIGKPFLEAELLAIIKQVLEG